MNILIVDDHPVLRAGVAAVLKQAVEDVEVLHAESASTAMALIASRPELDLVFLDLMLPDADGFDVLEKMTAQHPALPIIMLSSSEEPALVRKALSRGALGYVPKSASSATLLAALRLVLSGEIYVPPLLARPPVELEDRGASGVLALTDRQAEVLRMVCREKSNKEIAYELSLSEKTVKAHVTAIFRALNVANRGEAVRVAQAAGAI